MEKTTILAVVLVAVFAIGTIVYLSPLRPLAVYGYAKSVPIQIGYDEAREYWVLSAVVDETTAFKLVLDDETSESVSSNEEVITESEVGILIEPIQPYSKTNLYDANIKYVVQSGWDPTRKTPSFDINDAGWLTTAVYELGVWKSGSELTSQQIEVDYQKPKVIYLETPEGIVTVNNLGILPQGVEVPSGDLILVYDEDGNHHIFPKANYLRMIDKWNDRVSMQFFIPQWKYDWGDVWEWSEKEGYLPQDVQLVHVSDVEITEEKEEIILIYFGIAFAGAISVYVPDDLADTVVVQLFAPKAKIVKVEPDPLPPINEGEKVTFSVTVKNVGTEGTIGVSASSISYSFTPLTAGTKNMQPDEVFTVKFEAHALNVEQDKETTTKIFAQGRGGSDTYDLKGTILNVEGFTPVIPSDGEDGEGKGLLNWQQYWWLIVLAIAIVVVVAIAVYYYKREG